MVSIIYKKKPKNQKKSKNDQECQKTSTKENLNNFHFYDFFLSKNHFIFNLKKNFMGPKKMVIP